MRNYSQKKIKRSTFSLKKKYDKHIVSTLLKKQTEMRKKNSSRSTNKFLFKKGEERQKRWRHKGERKGKISRKGGAIGLPFIGSFYGVDLARKVK